MATLSTTASPSIPAWARPQPNHRSLLGPVITDVFDNEPEFRRYGQSVTEDGLRDFIFAADNDAHDPETVFRRLRWGGIYVYASRSSGRVRRLARFFASGGFLLEMDPASVSRPITWLPIFSRHTHYFAARKVRLIRPGEVTERFTYDVELCKHTHARDETFVVCKRVPTVDSIVMRLKAKFPEASTEVLEKRARKFVDRIFPTFLTREAGILMILQEHLPSRYAHRVPRVIDMSRDIRGFVTELRMNWLRNGGAPMSTLEFAMQAADLLRAVHDSAGVMHLDLRLDNMVITEHGVGFVDFGSAVRVNENLSSNPLVGTMFDELMRTSHIQKMLYNMTLSGQVTAQHFCSQHGRPDKAIDLFYLALQFQTPHANPDLAGLIHHEPGSEMAKSVSELSNQILKPPDPNDTSHKSAKDVLRSLEMIELQLGAITAAEAADTPCDITSRLRNSPPEN